MSLQRVARANVLRNLRLGDVLSHQTRVIGVQNQLRRLSLATNSRFSTPLAGFIPAVNAQQSRSFATETADSKKSTKKSTTKKPKAEKKKPKRGLTEKQKEAKEKKESRELVKQLKETALQPPKKLAQTARTIATQAKLKEVREQNPSRPQAEIFKEAVELVNSQRLAEADRYVNQAEENRAANEASYAAWLKEYTPLQIKQANSARKHLRRLGHSKFYGIQDERLVKAPLNTYMFFLKERHDSSDFKHLPVKDAALRIAEEWKSLTDSEKQPYIQKAERDQERYREEYREAYGEDAPLPKPKASST
ncbi:hypothetical protein PoHVEF18_001607 [Penicillium ochrochloron]